MAHARKVAQRLGIPLYEVSITKGLQAFGPLQWVDLVHTCENAFTGPEQIYKLSIYHFAKRLFPQLKVFISGQGSDELNGGYTTQYTPDTEDGWMLFLMALHQLEANTRTGDIQKIVSWWNNDCQEYPLVNSSFLNDQRFFCDHTSHTLHASPWINFVKNKILDLQIYNLWKEDRLAAAVGAENRVPFLNPLVTNVVLSVPESMWPTMFFNKQILRKAFRNTLGPGLAERPKVPLYYGAGEAYTAMMMLQLMAEDKYALLDYTFPSPNTCPWIHKHHLIKYIEKALEYPKKA